MVASHRSEREKCISFFSISIQSKKNHRSKTSMLGKRIFNTKKKKRNKRPTIKSFFL